jgi:regulator of cell morphogenesis and NO signaling
MRRIDPKAFVTDIVTSDYRTADIFRKYGIDFCCGGKWPLETVCELNGFDLETIQKELEEAIRTIHVSNSLPFESWDIDFLTDYIINVHHKYMVKALPETKEYLEKFAAGHRKKFEYLEELEKQYAGLYKEMMPHLKHEEEIIFPYIRQISHAFESKESYAGLLVRTLRKPVEELMHHEHETVLKRLTKLRQLTDNYTTPEKACASHRVTFGKLRELDSDMVQHLHLENNILFPRAVAMEKELLQVH